MTGARWKPALVAFLFALHPLHVESVAAVCVVPGFSEARQALDESVKRSAEQ